VQHLTWTLHAWEDYLFWQSNDKKIMYKINDLIKAIQRTPFEGIGKPERLRFEFAGKWSRRINQEHRLIYDIVDDELVIFQCRYHY